MVAKDEDIDVVKVVVVSEIAKHGSATAGEIKRALEKMLINASWGFVDRELARLERENYIKQVGDGESNIEEAPIFGWRRYVLTRKGKLFAKSKTVHDVLRILK